MLILYNLGTLMFFSFCIMNYKNILNIKKYIMFDSSLFLMSIIIIYFFKANLNIYVVLLQVTITYISLKILFKDYANILDVFFTMFYIVSYKLLSIIITNKFITFLILLIFALICFIYRKSMIDKYLKIIKLWNSNDEKSHTLRCVCVILFNLSIYLIYRLHV